MRLCVSLVRVVVWNCLLLSLSLLLLLMLRLQNSERKIGRCASIGEEVVVVHCHGKGCHPLGCAVLPIVSARRHGQH